MRIIGLWMVAIIVISMLLAFIFVRNDSKTIKLKRRGEKIETHGVISGMELTWDGKDIEKCHTYVKYTGVDNLEHEAILDTFVDLPLGRKVKIQYSPMNYETAAFVIEEL